MRKPLLIKTLVSLGIFAAISYSFTFFSSNPWASLPIGLILAAVGGCLGAKLNQRLLKTTTSKKKTKLPVLNSLVWGGAWAALGAALILSAQGDFGAVVWFVSFVGPVYVLALFAAGVAFNYFYEV